MSGINVQISMTNLTQVDRHQNDIHRLPATHQDQNAAIVQADAHKRVSMPLEPDATEKKNIDPENSRKENNRRKNKRLPTAQKVLRQRGKGNSDHLIDVNA